VKMFGYASKEELLKIDVREIFFVTLKTDANSRRS